MTLPNTVVVAALEGKPNHEMSRVLRPFTACRSPSLGKNFYNVKFVCNREGKNGESCLTAILGDSVHDAIATETFVASLGERERFNSVVGSSWRENFKFSEKRSSYLPLMNPDYTFWAVILDPQDVQVGRCRRDAEDFREGVCYRFSDRQFTDYGRRNRET